MFFLGKARHDNTSQTKNGPKIYQKWTKMDQKFTKNLPKMEQCGPTNVLKLTKMDQLWPFFSPKMDQKITIADHFFFQN